MTNDSLKASATAVSGMTAEAILVGPVEVTRDRAWETLTRHTTSEALRRHALAVEASTRAYARKFGEDQEFWGATALLHDFDWEIHPTLEQHPQDGAPMLREEGYPEELIQAVLSHADHLHLPRALCARGRRPAVPGEPARRGQEQEPEQSHEAHAGYPGICASSGRRSHTGTHSGRVSPTAPAFSATSRAKVCRTSSLSRSLRRYLR